MYTEYKSKSEILADSDVVPLLDLSGVPSDSNDWYINRKSAYSRLNQDELRFDDTVNGTTTWVDTIQAIKEEFPK